MSYYNIALPPHQKQELHRSILEYIKSLSQSESADDRVIRDLASILNLQDVDISTTQDNLLPKKWNSIVRLQRKILDLEKKIEALTEENDSLRNSLGNGSTSLSTIAKINWLPSRSQPNFQISTGSAATAVKLHPSLPILFACTDQGKLLAYDLMNYTMPIASIQAHMKGITSMDILLSQEKLLISTVSRDLQCKIFTFKDNNTFQLLRSLIGHEHIVSCVKLLQQNTEILAATCSRDLNCKIWNVSNGWCLKSFQAHTEWIRCLDIFGDYIVTGSNDCTLRLSHWPSARGLSLGLGHEYAVERVKIIPMLASNTTDGKETKPVSDGESGKNTGVENPFTVHDSAYAPLGFRYVLSSSRDKTLKLWKVPLPKLAAHRPPQPNPFQSQFELVKTFNGHSSWVRDIRVRDIHAFTSSDDSTVRCWNLITGECVKVWKDAHKGFINCLDVDENGTLREVLCTGGNDGKVNVFMR